MFIQVANRSHVNYKWVGIDNYLWCYTKNVTLVRIEHHSWSLLARSSLPVSDTTFKIRFIIWGEIELNQSSVANIFVKSNALAPGARDMRVDLNVGYLPLVL